MSIRFRKDVLIYDLTTTVNELERQALDLFTRLDKEQLDYVKNKLVTLVVKLEKNGK